MKIADYIASHSRLQAQASASEVTPQRQLVLDWVGRGKRVLDLGCGDGELSWLIKNNQNEVWGMELNPEAARMAESRGLRVNRGDLEKGLPYDSGWFDCVNLSDVLESVFDSRFLFDECARVLRPGGDLILTFRNLNSLSNRLRIFFGEYLAAHGAYPEDHHGTQWRIFNIGKIRELCDRSGFEVLEIQGLWAGPRAGRQVQRLLGKRLPDFGSMIAIRARRLART